uniref:Uncharacterized protein n=1 Tax=Anguilla anguilla TaxID=7936 RepID=A0A0E9RC07_ANGAN
MCQPPAYSGDYTNHIWVCIFLFELKPISNVCSGEFFSCAVSQILGTMLW